MRAVGAQLEPVLIARQSHEAFIEYLKTKNGQTDVNVLAARANAGPTFFFDQSVDRLNFDRGKMAFASFADHMIAPGSDERMLYVEAKDVADLSSSLAGALHLPFAPEGTPALLWMGNKTGTHTHFDVMQNVACVVSGRRQFTLFPPSQTPNLYMCPFEASPSGAPVSMVRLEDPDFDRHPAFREALKHVLVAELEPGDAIFITYMWWHHVKALDDFNMLVNYWWNEPEIVGAPIDAMLHAILVIRDLPPPMRDAWRTMFETFVFKAHGEPMDYIEPESRGGLGPLDDQGRSQMWQALGSALHPIMQRMFNQRR